MSPPDLRAEPEHAQAVLEGLQYPGEVLEGLELDGCTIRSCVFSGASLPGARFEDCTFIGCDLSNASLPDARLAGVTFVECKLVGVDFIAVRPVGIEVEFRASILQYAAFSGLFLKGTRFRDCDATFADFTRTDLRTADFSGTDLGGATFHETDLRGARLHQARGVDLDPTHNRIAKATLNPEAAVRALRRLGAVVEDGA